jgi:hypothetical protein
MTTMSGGPPRDDRLTFLVLARTGSGPYPHPVEICLYPDGRDSRMSFSIGPHVVNAGGQLALTRVLDDERTGLAPAFTTEFDAAELHWAVPYLVRLHAGEDVRDEIIAAYRERHGKEPDRLPQARYGE